MLLVVEEPKERTPVQEKDKPYFVALLKALCLVSVQNCAADLSRDVWHKVKTRFFSVQGVLVATE